MNIKRYLLSVFAVFITFEVMSYVVNSLLLTDCYKELAPVWRKDMMHFMWLRYLVDLLFSIFFVLIYSKWNKKFSLRSGLLYGLMAGLMMNTTTTISQWIIYPITNHLMVLWVFFGLIQFLICGMVMGKIYQPRKTDDSIIVILD
jgi:hypothetical protein